LASLLWALKLDTIDLSALSGAQHLAGSGRTSFPVDKVLPRDAYRVLGYRQCGERAVRVDILERLADLIRPALAWREASPGEKPAGAFDGRGFVVTQSMTSLTGSAGEDFASILRALGYRMERRAPLPPKPVAVEVPAAEAVAAEGAVEAVAVSAEAMPSGEATLLPDIAFSDAPEPAPVEAKAEPAPEPQPEPVAAVEAAPVEATAPEPVAEAAHIETEAPPEPVVAEAAPETASEAAPAESVAAAEAGAESEAAPAETATDVIAAPEAPIAPEMIEVWRPGGRSEERRPPRHDRNRPRHQDRQARPAEGAPPAVAATGEAGKGERHGRRRNRHSDFRTPRPGAPAEGAAVAAAPADGAPAAREPREDRGRPPRERFEGKPREGDKGRDNKDRGKFGGGRDKGGRDGGRDRDKGGRGDKGGPSHRQYATSAAPRERDRPVDPNSPFAKLAALKEQLAANRKD
jgi:ATP-dependent RNA helicase SUPV3L1/SUV3